MPAQSGAVAGRVRRKARHAQRRGQTDVCPRGEQVQLNKQTASANKLASLFGKRAKFRKGLDGDSQNGAEAGGSINGVVGEYVRDSVAVGVTSFDEMANLAFDQLPSEVYHDSAARCAIVAQWNAIMPDMAVEANLGMEIFNSVEQEANAEESAPEQPTRTTRPNKPHGKPSSVTGKPKYNFSEPTQKVLTPEERAAGFGLDVGSAAERGHARAEGATHMECVWRADVTGK